MTINGEDSSVDSKDYGFISKYVRDDSNDVEANLFKKKFETKEFGSTEVFNSIGQEEDNQENINFSKRYNKNFNKWQNNKDEESEVFDESFDEKEKSISDPVSEAKKEFLEHLEKDSLTVDTCIKLTHDWKK